MATSNSWPLQERNDSGNTSVIIVGAGISGICTAIDLIRHNKCQDFVIVEKSNDVGGTWNDNKYPGCCCDVWSHLYSLSFEPNPHWSYEYSGQEEIHAYLVSVAQKWGLYKHIRFGTEVEEARWNDTTSKWNVTVNVLGGKAAEYGSSYTIVADFFVSAVGQLNVPRYPDIEGLDSFKGKVMHSARWDWNYNLAGKKIAIIGNGATAAQIIPEVAQACEKLTVLQRTPNWVVPRDDKPITKTRQTIYQFVPPIRKKYRAALMDFREMFYEAAVVPDSALNNEMKRQCLDMMAKQIPNNPKLRESLVPNYPPGCKRIIISDDYFVALNRPNVALETRHIQRITPEGIQVDGELVQAEVLILATGFRTVEFMHPIKIYGKNGRPIEDIWRAGGRAYLGITVESLPNFSMLYGPNTNLGHNSIILMIEAQSRYINELISATLRAKAQNKTLTITPSKETVDTFNAAIQARLQKSTFANENCRSWYKNADGVITNNWCGNVVEYQKRTSAVVWADFDITGNGAQTAITSKRSELGRVVEESHYGLVDVLGLSTAAVTVMAAGAFAYTRRHGLKTLVQAVW